MSPRKSSRRRSPPDGLVLGLDPGTTGMGYAFVDPRREPARIVECGLVPAEGASNAERMRAIAFALDALLAKHRPTAVAIERLFFNRNARTAMAVAEARGVALLCVARAGIEVAEYTPQEVKLSVTGTGGADKKQVQRMVGLLLRLDRPIAQDNVADAVAIALTHAQRARLRAAIAAASS